MYFKRMGDLEYAYYCEEHGPANGAAVITTWRKIRRRSVHVREHDANRGDR